MMTVADARRRLREIADENPDMRWPTEAELVELLSEENMGETQMVGFRMPFDLLERLDKQAERLKREIPGVDWTRTAVVRYLLTQALDQAEKGGEGGGR